MTKRTPIVVGNWKMHTSFSDAMVLATHIKNQLEPLRGVEVVICPPFVWLYPIAELFRHGTARHVFLAAQNVSSFDEGAFTGEVSGRMLKHLTRYVIVGHSERLTNFGENNDSTNKKIHAALRHGLTPIICVGESKQSSHPEQEVIKNLKEILNGISKYEREEIIIAYEPVWAISSHGKHPASGALAQRVAQAIHIEVSDVCRVLYGGSVTSSNVLEFIGQPDIDGVLVGSASLKVSEFVNICQLVANQ